MGSSSDIGVGGWTTAQNAFAVLRAVSQGSTVLTVVVGLETSNVGISFLFANFNVDMGLDEGLGAFYWCPSWRLRYSG
jgi:hypothetical protein